MTRWVAGDAKPLKTTSVSANLNSNIMMRINNAVDPIGIGSSAHNVTPKQTIAVINLAERANVSGKPKNSNKKIEIAIKVLLIFRKFSLSFKGFHLFCLLILFLIMNTFHVNIY